MIGDQHYLRYYDDIADPHQHLGHHLVLPLRRDDIQALIVLSLEFSYQLLEAIEVHFLILAALSATLGLLAEFILDVKERIIVVRKPLSSEIHVLVSM